MPGYPQRSCARPRRRCPKLARQDGGPWCSLRSTCSFLRAHVFRKMRVSISEKGSGELFGWLSDFQNLRLRKYSWQEICLAEQCGTLCPDGSSYE